MTMLTLTPPLEIGPRLMPSVAFEGGRVSLDPSDLTYYIDLDDGTEVSGTDFRAPHALRQTPDEFVRNAMGSLLSFLSAFAEAHRPDGYGPESDNYDLFPIEIGEWAYLNLDEIAMAGAELEESDG